MLAIAFLVASKLACIEAKNQKINPDFVFQLLFIILISGIIGARILYVVSNLGDYLDDPKEIFMLQHGGLSWFGGLLFAIAAAAYYLNKRKEDKYRVLDLIAPYVALAQAIGRIGCFLNGCCYAKSGQLIPSQLVSSFFLLISFIILRFMQNRPHQPGKIFFGYLTFYSLKRFFVEFLRGDSKVLLWGLSGFQFTSILLFLFSLSMLIKIARNK